MKVLTFLWTDGETENQRRDGQEVDGAACQVCGESQEDLYAGSWCRREATEVRVKGQGNVLIYWPIGRLVILISVTELFKIIIIIFSKVYWLREDKNW